MTNDADIRTQGIKALIGALGPNGTDRFLTLLDRRPDDYAKWRDHLFEGMSIEEVNEEASKVWDQHRSEKPAS